MKKYIIASRRQNLLLRLFLLIIVIIPLFMLDEFLVHFKVHFTGSLLPSVIRNEWPLVIMNILLFISFLIPLSFRRKINWKEYSIIIAFFISLFVEMYGIPLTIFFASRFIPGGSESVESIFLWDFPSAWRAVVRE